MKSSRGSDGDSFEAVEMEEAVPDQTLEPANSHLVEPAFNLRESLSSIISDMRAPLAQSILAEYQVRPREHGKQMPPERVIPGGPERSQDIPRRPEHSGHRSKNSSRICEVVESINRDNYISGFGRRFAESDIVTSGLCRLFSSERKQVLTDVHPADLKSAALSELNGFRPRTTAKVNNSLVPDFIPDALA